MPLKAFIPELKKTVCSFDNDFSNPRDYHLVCPLCKSEMIYVNAELRIKHFRHKRNGECPYTRETIEHMEAKKVLYETLSNCPGVTCVDVEHSFGSRVADVYLERDDGKAFAVEVQHSSITFAEWLKRTKDYTSKGIYVLWVCSKPKSNNEIIRLNLLQKFNHYLNYGRFYWVDKKGIHATHVKYFKKTLGVPTNYTLTQRDLALVGYTNKLPNFKFFNTGHVPDTMLRMAKFSDRRFWFA